MDEDHSKYIVVVPNLPDNIDEGFLKRYFGNTKHSGGGDISNVEIRQGSGGSRCGVVCFADPKVAQRVLTFEKGHSFRDEKVKVLSPVNWALDKGTPQPQDGNYKDPALSSAVELRSEDLNENHDGVFCFMEQDGQDQLTMDTVRISHGENGRICPAQNDYIGVTHDITLENKAVLGSSSRKGTIMNQCGINDVVSHIKSCPGHVVKYIEGGAIQLPTQIGCSVRFDIDFQHIIFDGTANAVDHSIWECEQIIAKIRYKLLGLSEAGKRFFATAKHRNKIEECLRKHKSSARIYDDAENYGIIVYIGEIDETISSQSDSAIYHPGGDNRDDDVLDKLVKDTQQYYAYQLRKAITNRTQRNFFNSEGCLMLVSEFEANNMVDIFISEFEMVIEGNIKDVHDLDEMLSYAMPCTTTSINVIPAELSETVHLKVGVFRLLDRHRQVVCDEINKGYPNYLVAVQFSRHDSDCKLVLTGSNIEEVKQAATKITEFIRYEVTYRTVDFKQDIQRIDDHFKTSPYGKACIENIERDNKSVVEIRTRSRKSQRGIDLSGSCDSQAQKVQIRKGNIQEFLGAEVLVNSVVTNGHKLYDCGAVSKAFAQAGGRQLDMDIKDRLPIREGAVEITPASGNIPSKSVLHVGIRNWKGKEALGSVVQKCFQMARQNGFQSIAFPTLGCGKMGYPKYDVYQCIQEQANVYPDFKVYIVAFDDPLYQALTVYSKSKTDQFHNATSKENCLTFHVNALTEYGANETINSLHSLIKNNIIEEPRQSPTRNTVRPIQPSTARPVNPSGYGSRHRSDDRATDTKKTNHGGAIAKEYVPSFQSRSGTTNYATVKPDTPSFTGRFGTINRASAKPDPRSYRGHYRTSKSATAKHDARSYTDHSEIFKSRNDHREKGFLERRADEIEGKCPKNWIKYKGKITDKIKVAFGGEDKYISDPYSDVQSAVKKLMLSIWSKDKGLVGHGADARGIKQGTTIDIVSVQQIENPKLFQKYNTQRINLCHMANRYPKLEGLQGGEDVKTFNESLAALNSLLIPEVNERYLFHGTSDSDTVDAIIKQGLDFRLGDKGGLFGKGIYLAESPVKSDQYTDKPGSRSGGVKHVLLCRVLIGKPYVCKEARSLSRPPCSKCYKEKCKHSEFFDSVIGTHKGQHGSNTLLCFREFVVYEKDTVYPEFLIKYIRK